MTWPTLHNKSGLYPKFTIRNYFIISCIWYLLFSLFQNIFPLQQQRQAERDKLLPSFLPSSFLPSFLFIFFSSSLIFTLLTKTPGHYLYVSRLFVTLWYTWELCPFFLPWSLLQDIRDSLPLQGSAYHTIAFIQKNYCNFHLLQYIMIKIINNVPIVWTSV